MCAHILYKATELSLVVQWLRIHLPMQGTQVWSLQIQEYSTCPGATKPAHDNYWARTLEPMRGDYWVRMLQLLKPGASPRAQALPQEKPLRWGAPTRQRRVAPTRRNSRKPSHSNEDPAQPKKKFFLKLYIYMCVRVDICISTYICLSMCVYMCQLCPTLCNPLCYTVHGILQARILEWVAFPFSRGPPQPRDQTQVSHIAGRVFTSWATREAQEYWSGEPIPSPADLPDPRIKPGSPSLQVDSLPTEPAGKPLDICIFTYICLCMCEHVYMCVYIYMYSISMHTCICMDICVYVSEYRLLCCLYKKWEIWR